MADADMLFDALRERVMQRVEAAMNAVGDEIVDVLHEMLDVNYPPASVEGEPPHHRTGALQRGVSQETFPGSEDTITTTVMSIREGTPGVPEVLEGPLNRPYMSRIQIELPDTYPAMLMEALGVAA
jgi:hypothetical protein